MAQEISKDTKIKLSLETIISLGVVLVSMTGMWFTLKGEIAEAKELPVAPAPEVTRIEYDMKSINNESRMETIVNVFISIIFLTCLVYCFFTDHSDTF
jgi:hypothetical protein